MGDKALERAPLLAYLVLALCVAMSAALCADLYAGIAERAVNGPAVRTAGQFVAMKIRQAGSAGDISVRDGALVLMEHGDGEDFTDEIYWHDGCLMELYAPKDAVFYGERLDAGDRILECGGASFRLSDGTVRYSFDFGNGPLAGIAFQRGGGTE